MIQLGNKKQVRAYRSMAGFGLVEIMVAMVIGMIATIVVMQVFFGSEERGRAAGGAAEAQNIGAMTFYQVQNNIKKAGYGFNSVGLMQCGLNWNLPGGALIDKAVQIAPVSINPQGIKAGIPSALLPAGDANTDTLLIMYGTGNGQPQGNPILEAAGTSYKMQLPGSFAIGDRVLVAPGSAPGSCGGVVLTMDRVTAVDPVAVALATGGTSGESLFNLGRGPNGINQAISNSNPTNGPTVLAYAIRNSSLTVCDFTVNDCSLDSNKNSSTVWVPLASNVVSMRATYMKDPNWNGNPINSDLTLPTTACGWAQVRAISLALVVRSPNPEKEIVTKTTQNGVTAAQANHPVWDQDAVAPLVAATGTLGPDAAADEPWKYYRYKTFQTVIPLRNITWMGRPNGC